MCFRIAIMLVIVPMPHFVWADEARQPQVVRDQVMGSINHGGGKTEWQRVMGKARALDPRTLEFADGTRIDLDITVPEPDQMALMGDSLYPAGKEAAEFLGKLLGDRPAMCFKNDRGGPWMGYVGDTNLERAMIVNGWALADHSSLHADEIIARENKRGLWRGKFVHPDEWRAGVRLPGEPPPARLVDERQMQGLLQLHASSDAACATLVARIVQDLPDVRRLRFPIDSQLTDDGLAQLTRLTALEELDLGNCGRITDTGLAHLKALPRLKRLGLPYKVTDASLEHLANVTELEELSLAWAAITDQGFARLKGLHRLRRLTLFRINITDTGLGHLRGLKSLVVLVIDGRASITDSGLAHLNELVDLQFLEISGTDVTDAGALQLHGLKRLRVLKVPERVTDKAKDRLRETLPNLRFEGRPEDVVPVMRRSSDEAPQETSNAATTTDDKPLPIVGSWRTVVRHLALGSLYQPVHTVRKREATVHFLQTGNRLTGHAGGDDDRWG